MSATNIPEPFHVAVCLFPGFQLLDVCGPLDILNVLNYTHPLKLSLIAPTLEPVTTRTINTPQSSFDQHLVPTHTYSEPPTDHVHALFVPGGFGIRPLVQPSSDPSVQAMKDWIKLIAKNCDYIWTVCTGSALLGHLGVLDGKKATSNKRSFDWVKTQSSNVDWIRKARWVHDGNVWTSSGVAAGMDMTLAFIASLWGDDTATNIANGIEHDWHKDSAWDPFASLYE
ncbi:hypothetical protein OIV83_005795 [Microbotryomycetes sp. JL201]|nr:hypothetical protein OIV83_005795 [Microbotryomycetes sp. JL201]